MRYTPTGLKSSFHKLLLSVLLLVPLRLMAIEIAPLANEEQVKQALVEFKSWTQYYQQIKYSKQYKLVHPRIQRYRKKKLWSKIMKSSARKNGALIDYQILGVSAIIPTKIPCTEMGHCYRKDMQTVIIILNSNYEKVGKKEKEYVVMTNSNRGWRFGGGTFLNLPFGETMVILDRADENKYKFKGIKVL